MIHKQAEKIAEEIFEEAIKNKKRRNGEGLSPTLITDWTEKIEAGFEAGKQEEREEIIEKIRLIMKEIWEDTDIVVEIGNYLTELRDLSK